MIADNASTSRVVFGNTLRKPSEFDLELVGATLSINGQIKELRSWGSCIRPSSKCNCCICQHACKKRKKIKKGDLILSGALTSAIMLNVGDFVTGKFDGLGEVTFSIGE